MSRRSLRSVATKLALATLINLVASGCSHVPLTTVYKLATFDPASANPAVLRVALRYPDALALGLVAQ